VDPPKKDVTVVFEVVRGAANIVQAGKSFKQSAKTDKDGKARVEINLTRYGGDEFTVKTYLKKGGKELKTETFVVWRRLYCQMSRFMKGKEGNGQPENSMRPVPALDLADLTSELENHYIELIDKSAQPTIKRHANVIDNEQDPGRVAPKAAALDGYDDTLEPVTVRIVVVNQIATSKTARVKKENVANQGKVKFSFASFPWNDPSCVKDTDWLVRLEWKWNDAGDWTALPPRWVARTGAKKAEVDLAGAALGGPDDAGRTVDVRVTYRYLSGSTNGRRNRNVFWLASSYMDEGPRDADDLSQTTLHELGHTLGMVPVTQSTHYAVHGHQGPHCSTGLSSSDRAKSTYGGMSGTCIMFGENAVSRLGKFCAQCTKSVRGASAQIEGIGDHW
jgi:hypothetical protein